MENITKYLIETLGFKKESLALRLKASVRSIERWRDGGTPFHFYQIQLERILEKENRKETP